MCHPITKTGATQTVIILVQGSQHKWTTNHCKEKYGCVRCDRKSGSNYAIEPGGFNADKDTEKKSLDQNSGYFIINICGLLQHATVQWYHLQVRHTYRITERRNI